MNEEEILQHNPFQKIKLRYLLLWWVLGSFVLIAFFHKRLEKLAFEALIEIVFYAIPLVWMAVTFTRTELSLKKLVGTTKNQPTRLQYLLIFVSLVIFAIGCTQVIEYILSYIAPRSLSEHLKQLHKPFLYSTKDSTYYIPLDIIKIVTAVIIAPVAEELVCRGLLLHRLTYKWNIKAAIIVSSVIFGAMHGYNAVGSFVFALMMCILYLKTKSLKVSIAFHMLNNLLVCVLAMIGMLYLPARKMITIAEIRSGWPGALALCIISASFLSYYLYKNWPVKDTTLPYYS